MYIVYQTTNLVNGKIYVGIHKQKGKKFDGYLGSGTTLKKAIKKYGENNFVRKILFECETRKDAFWLEKIIVNEYFIELEDSYNLKVGGIGGKLTKAGRKAISERAKKHRPSAETKRKIGISSSKKIVCYSSVTGNPLAIFNSAVEARKLTGFSVSQYNTSGILLLPNGNNIKLIWIKTEDRKISPLLKEELNSFLTYKIRKNTSGKNNPMYGKYGKFNPFSKPVICISENSDQQLGIFDTIKAAAKFAGVTNTCISAAARGRQKTAGKLNNIRLKWKYIEDSNVI